MLLQVWCDLPIRNAVEYGTTLCGQTGDEQASRGRAPRTNEGGKLARGLCRLALGVCSLNRPREAWVYVIGAYFAGKQPGAPSGQARRWACIDTPPGSQMIGVDLVAIRRIWATYERFGARFLRRAYSDLELSRFHELSPRMQPQFLASRFASPRWPSPRAAPAPQFNISGRGRAGGRPKRPRLSAWAAGDFYSRR